MADSSSQMQLRGTSALEQKPQPVVEQREGQGENHIGVRITCTSSKRRRDRAARPVQSSQCLCQSTQNLFHCWRAEGLSTTGTVNFTLWLNCSATCSDMPAPQIAASPGLMLHT